MVFHSLVGLEVGTVGCHYDWHMRVWCPTECVVIACPAAARKWNSELKKMQLSDVNKLCMYMRFFVTW